MHRAAAVSYPIGRSHWHLGAIAVLWSLACVATFLYFQSLAYLHWRVLLLALLGVAGAVALWAWKNTPSGDLQWDEQGWRWSGFTVAGPCRLNMVCDLQRIMLLRLVSPSGQVAWLWPSFEAAQRQWTALRRAVVATPQSIETAHEVEK